MGPGAFGPWLFSHNAMCSNLLAQSDEWTETISFGYFFLFSWGILWLDYQKLKYKLFYGMTHRKCPYYLRIVIGTHFLWNHTSICDSPGLFNFEKTIKGWMLFFSQSEEFEVLFAWQPFWVFGFDVFRGAEILGNTLLYLDIVRLYM